MKDVRLTTQNRFMQVSWLRELAGDLSWNADEGTAEEIVAYALDEAEEKVELPEWFDEHDRRLLTRMVERRIA